MMFRLFKRTWVALAVVGAVNTAAAFSMLGPPDTTFQIERIGYNIQPNIFVDAGGPMNLGEEYRWNVRPILYGFDSSFKNYFGQKGMEEIRKAIAILNDLPPMSKVSADLHEFPTDTRRVNYRAAALGLLDLKSFALGTLTEEVGLASPERYVWCLAARIVSGATVTYDVIKRNFDPVTLAPSSYVNDTLYTYTIIEYPTTRPVADAVELPVDPLAFQYTSVASTIDTWNVLPLQYGGFYTGLTRDDVGGLRYIYSGKKQYVNYNIEGLVADAITNGTTGVVVGGNPWGTVSGSNAPVSIALRPGIDKLSFKEAKYDSTLGFFVTVTNVYNDSYITNSHKYKQTYQRVIVEPDIIFGAADLGGAVLARTTTTNWVNNTAINSQVVLAGPGIIQPPIFITFNKTGPYYVNSTPSSLDEQTAAFNFLWGSFDGTTNDPVIYPLGTSIQDVEQQVLSGGP